MNILYIRHILNKYTQGGITRSSDISHARHYSTLRNVHYRKRRRRRRKRAKLYI